MTCNDFPLSYKELAKEVRDQLKQDSHQRKLQEVCRFLIC